MAAPAKKGGGLGLLALMGGGEGGDASDPMAEKQAAVREMFAAAKRGDWEGAAHSFKEAYDLCAGEGGEDMTDEEDDYELEED